MLAPCAASCLGLATVTPCCCLYNSHLGEELVGSPLLQISFASPCAAVGCYGEGGRCLFVLDLLSASLLL